MYRFMEHAFYFIIYVPDESINLESSNCLLPGALLYTCVITQPGRSRPVGVRVDRGEHLAHEGCRSMGLMPFTGSWMTHWYDAHKAAPLTAPKDVPGNQEKQPQPRLSRDAASFT